MRYDPEQDWCVCGDGGSKTSRRCMILSRNGVFVEVVVLRDKTDYWNVLMRSDFQNAVAKGGR